MQFSLLELSLMIGLMGFCGLILFIRKRPQPKLNESKGVLILKLIFYIVLVTSIILITKVGYAISRLYIPSPASLEEVMAKISDHLLTFNEIKNITFLFLIAISILLQTIGVKREKNYYLATNLYFTFFTLIHGFYFLEQFLKFEKDNGFWKGGFSTVSITEAITCLGVSLFIFATYFIIGLIKYKFKGRS